MANNRMHLVCPGCREYILLGKTFGQGWYKAPTQEALEQFYTKHSGCGITGRAFVFVSEGMEKWWYDKDEKVEFGKEFKGRQLL